MPSGPYLTRTQFNIAYRQACRVARQLPISPMVMSAESQLEQMERLVAACDEQLRGKHDPDVVARVVHAASAAHRTIAYIRAEQNRGKKKADANGLRQLSDEELEQKRQQLVQELAK